MDKPLVISHGATTPTKIVGVYCFNHMLFSNLGFGDLVLHLSPESILSKALLVDLLRVKLDIMVRELREHLVHLVQR